MERKYINIDGVNLFYAEANADAGTVIFFFHGNSSSHVTWQKQLESSALSDFRLVAFDLPAHGLSDPASGVTNGYSLPGIGALMAKAVLKLCDGKPFLLAGVSLGTNIIAEMLAYSLYPSGILLAGPCILGGEYTAAKIMKPGTCIGLSFVDDITDEDLRDVQKLIANETGEAVVKQVSKDFRSVKDHFRSSLGKSVAAGLLSDQVAMIKERRVPALVIFGGDDPAIYPDYLDEAGFALWNSKVVKLAGAGHWVQLDEPEKFTMLLKDFADGVLKPVGS